MNLAISDNKYKPGIPSREDWQKYTDYKREIEGKIELSREEKDRLIAEYLDGMGL